MNKTRENKRTLTTSAIVLLLCIVALIGATAAWFTSTASNTGNRIQAGTLKVDLLMDKTLNESAATDYVSIAGGTGDIFKEATVAQNSNVTLWEPGKTQIVYLAVENAGNLALKYNAYIDVTDEGLVGALEYALFDEGTYAKFKALGKTNWSDLKAAATVSGDVSEGRSVISTGVLDEITKGTQNERDYVALAVHMKETAGNEYQGKDCIIDVTISAAQLASENDGFGTNTYDNDATIEAPTFPIHETVVTDKGVKKETTETLTFVASGDVIGASLAKTSAAALFTDAEKIDASKDMLLSLTVNTTGQTVSSVTYDLSLYKTITTTVGPVTIKGETAKVTNTLATYLAAQIQLTSGLKNVVVTHSGNAMDALASASADPTSASGGYYYDKSTGVLTIKSKSFSPFTVSYDLDTDAEIMISKDGKIIALTSFVEFKQMILDTDTYHNFNGYLVTLLKDVDLSTANMDLFRENNSEIFAGTFDGNNHSISGFNNLCDENTPKYASLFYYLYNATIKDLTIKNSTFDNSDSSSSMLAYLAYGDSLLLDNVDFVNCHITNGWENQFYIFVPQSDVTTVKNCSVDETSSMDCIYGNYGCWFRQVCYTDFNMIDCVNNASMRGRGFVGTFVGQLGTNVYHASFTNCVNNGEIRIFESSSGNGRFLYGGGFIGYKNSSVEVAGEQTITFTNCKNNGNIIVEDVSGNTGFNGGAVGGYIGYTSATTLIFNNCESNGNVGSSLIQRAAGFVGWENGTSTITFTNCKQTGNVTSNSTNGIAGAFVAANNGTTNMSTSGGTVTGLVAGKTITKINGEE